MKTRVLKNWRTTLIGGVLLVASLLLLLLRIITGGEFIALLPTIIGLLCAPDNVLKKIAEV